MKNCKPVPPSCPPPLRQNDRLRSYAAVVRDFLRRFGDREAEERRHFSKQPDLATAVKYAVMSTYEGKRHSHQCRIPGSSLEQAYSILKRCKLDQCTSFDELHNCIEMETEAVSKIGKLATYDFAYRIGCYLGLKPKRIYLHCGTKKGAAALGLGRGCNTLERSDMPAEFAVLSAGQIEDCLCIYKDDLGAN